MSELKDFLGYRIIQERKTKKLKLSDETYIEKTLVTLGLEDSKSFSKSLPSNVKI